MFRIIVLCLAVMIGIGAIVPFATELVEAGSKTSQKHRKYKKKKIKKYSKRWWREYRAKQRKRAALAKRKRALRLRTLRLAKSNEVRAVRVAAQPKADSVKKTKTGVEEVSAVLPSGKQAPKGWKTNKQTESEVAYRVENNRGSQVGSASVTVVGPAVSGDESQRSKTVGGVATSSLRRTVIDKMIRENGWVVNDYQKEVGGRKVFVVEAQSQASNGQLQTRLFYFAESEGRIYSIATNAPANSNVNLAAEAERALNSLGNGATQQARSR